MPEPTRTRAAGGRGVGPRAAASRARQFGSPPKGRRLLLSLPPPGGRGAEDRLMRPKGFLTYAGGDSCKDMTSHQTPFDR